MSRRGFSEALDYRVRPLEGRVALVFGAGVCAVPGAEGLWGNGEAAAVAYAHAGARVACVDLDLERARETAKLVAERGGESLALSANVASSDDVERAVKDTLDAFQQIDVLHNNVGMSPFGDPVSLDEDAWARTFAVNVNSVFLACKFVLPLMRARRHGAIVNISSILAGVISEYDLSSYYASKAALEHLTRAIAVKDAPLGIRANVVRPGLINTPQIHAHEDIVDLHGSVAETVAKRDAMSPTLKQGSAWDIAHTSVFLASDAARYINGQVISVDGGLTCKQAAQPHPTPIKFG